MIYKPQIKLDDLSTLAKDPKPRFINRQAGSATRLVLDTLLQAEQIDSSKIDGYQEEEHTHTAVAARIASGERDIGFAERRVAEKFSLEFTPLVAENFYVSWKSELQNEIKNEIIAHFATLNTATFEHVTLHDLRGHLGDTSPSIANI